VAIVALVSLVSLVAEVRGALTEVGTEGAES
jgi:hypothetical protein